MKSAHSVLFALDVRNVRYLKSGRTNISPNVLYWEPWTRQSATQSQDEIYILCLRIGYIMLVDTAASELRSETSKTCLEASRDERHVSTVAG